LLGVSILTDGNGAVFRERAAEAVRDDVGLEILQQLQEWVETVQINDLEEYRLEEEKAVLDREIEECESPAENGEKLENPTRQLDELRRKGILRLALEDDQDLSKRILTTEGLIGNRMAQGKVNQGNLSDPKKEGLIDRFFFQEYLLRYLGCYGKEKEESPLAYQLEYLIMGKEADVDNLKGVAEKLCHLREASNAIYLFSDAEKCSEAEALASTVCTVILLPELIPAVKTVILLGWIYAESVYDVKLLLAGEKVPLLKDRESWHLNLGDALRGDFGKKAGGERGLEYADYLRIYLMLMDLETLTGRAMNMVEADIRSTQGNTAFRLDGCYDRVQAKINVASGRGYAFELIRTKSY